MKRNRVDSNNALLEACKTGTFEQVCAALDEGASENTIDLQTGTSALMLVCSRTDDWPTAHKMASTLLNRGALCNIQNISGNFALHLAARYSSVEMVNMIATRWPPALNDTNKRGNTPIMWCVSRVDTEGPRIIDELAMRGAKFDNKDDAMTGVCRTGTYDMVCALAKHYPESCHYFPAGHCTPLMAACQNHKYGTKMVDFLVCQQGVPVDTVDRFGCSIVYCAFTKSPEMLRCVSQYVKTSKELGDKKYDPTVHHKDPLGFAREGAHHGFTFDRHDFKRHPTAAWAIIRDAGLTIDKSSPFDVFNVMAASDDKQLWLIVARELHTQPHSDTGDTLLHVAARSNKLFAVEMLMRRRVNPFLLNCKNERAIDVTTDPIVQERLLYYHRFKMERAHLDWLGPYFEKSAVLFMWVVKRCKLALPKEVCTLILEQLRRKMYA